MINRSIELEATLRLALEALDFSTSPSPCVEELQDDAIAAIKEALTQPVVTESHKQSTKCGEPVALQIDVIVVNLVREGINKHRARELAEHFIKHTTPPTQQSCSQRTTAEGEDTRRAWVNATTWRGLTSEEIRQLEKENTVNGYHGDYCPTWDLIQATEAKLKEKNTRNGGCL